MGGDAVPEGVIGELLRSAIERGPSIVMITDGKGRIIYVNRRFTEVTGYASEEVLGKTPRVLQSGKTEAHIYASLWETIKAGHVWNGEILNRRKDGSLFWEDEHIAPICGVRGRVRYFVMFGHDASARKHMEEEASRLLSENQRLVRKMMLVEQAERDHMARELHDNLGQYLAAIKTEAVRMLTRMDGEHAELAACAGNIIADTEELFDLVHRLTLRLQPDMIAQMGLEAALQQLVGRWQMRTGVHCELNLAPDLDGLSNPVATATYCIVRESLTNVLKHADARHVRIGIRHMHQHGDGSVRISVCDDGIGLSPDIPEHLGLGIVGMRERATSLGGRLWIEGDDKRFCVLAELPIHATNGTA